MTDRAIAAQTNRSPFSSHEPFVTPEDPTALNFPPYMRQICRAVFESLTQEEVSLLYRLFIVGFRMLGDLSLDKVHGEAEAYNWAWKKMKHYRETGEP